MIFKFATFDSITDTIAKPHSMEWNEFIEKWMWFKQTSVKEERTLFSPLVYNINKRKDCNVKEATGIVLDFDNKDANVILEDVQKGLFSLLENKYKYCIHSTFNHTLEKYKFRLIIPFGEPIRPRAWPDIWNKFYYAFPEHIRKGIDTSCKSLSRAYFLPTYQPGAERFIEAINEGQFFNPHSLPPLKAFKEKERLITASLNDTYNATLDALNYLSSDCSRQDWIEVAMCLEHEFGNRGFKIWDDWSRKSSKYPKAGERTAREVWNSIDHKSYGGRPLTIATLFDRALKSGYKPHIETLRITPEVHNDTPSRDDILKKLLPAPGLLGELQQWIDSCGPCSQPLLSLGAALTILGTVCGHRFRGEGGIRSNFMVMGVAPTGSGKDNAIKCIRSLLPKIGMHNNLGAEAGSDQGLYKSLHRSDMNVLVPIDEIGHYFHSLKNRNAAAYKTGIIKLKLSLFSSADSAIQSPQLKNKGGDDPSIELMLPHYCEYGVTTGDVFDCLTSKDILTGLLSRYLILEAGRTPKRWPFNDPNSPPEELVTKLKMLRFGETKHERSLMFLDLKENMRNIDIPCSAEARRLLLEFDESLMPLILKHDSLRDGMDAIWTRTAEHAAKIALILAERDGKSWIITQETMQWAINFAHFCSLYLYELAQERLSINEYEAELKKMLMAIKHLGRIMEDGWVNIRDITQRTRWVKDANRRDGILQLLVDGGNIEARRNPNCSAVMQYRYLNSD